MAEQNIQKKLASGLVWTFAESASAKIVNFLVTLVLARLLMPAEYGTVAIVNVVIAFLDVIVISGMGSALVQKKDSDSLDFSTITWFSLGIAVVLYAALFFGAHGIAVFFNSLDLVLILRVLGLRLFFTAINSVQQAYVSKHMMFRKFFFATMIGTLVSAALSIYLAYKGWGVWALVVQQLMYSLVNTLVIKMIISWRLEFKFSFERLKGLFSFGWKLLLSSLLDTFYEEIVSLSIGKKYTKADLAFYDKGKQIPATISAVVAHSMNKALFPAMSNVQTEIEQVKMLARNNTRVTAMIMYPMLVFFIVTAYNLMCFLFTEKWAETTFYIQILSVFFLIRPFSAINMTITKALGRSDILLKNNLIRKVMGIGVILMMVFMFDSPKYVVSGVLITGLLDVVINMIPNKRLINYSIWTQIKDTLPFLAFSLVMGALISPISRIEIQRGWILLAQSVVFFAGYLVTLKMSKNKTYTSFVSYAKGFLRK